MSKKDQVQEASKVEASTEVEVSTEDQAVRAAFDENVGQDEETTKMAMLQAGCKIKSVTRLYNQFMIDSGLSASKEEKDKVLDVELTDVELTDEETFNEKITAIAAAVTGATDKSAATMIRAWCRANEVECFKKVAGATRRSGFRFEFYDALRASPNMTAAEAAALITEKGSDNDNKAASHYQAIRELVNAVA